MSVSSQPDPVSGQVRPLKTPKEVQDCDGVICRFASASSFSFFVSER